MQMAIYMAPRSRAVLTGLVQCSSLRPRKTRCESIFQQPARAKSRFRVGSSPHQLEHDARITRSSMCARSVAIPYAALLPKWCLTRRVALHSQSGLWCGTIRAVETVKDNLLPAAARLEYQFEGCSTASEKTPQPSSVLGSAI